MLDPGVTRTPTNGHPRHEFVNCLQYSPDGGVIAVGYFGAVRLWSLAVGRLLGKPLAPPDGVNCVAFSRDSRQLRIGGRRGTVSTWDVATGLAVSKPLEFPGPVVEITPDGRIVVVAQGTQQFVAIDATTLKPLGPPLLNPRHRSQAPARAALSRSQVPVDRGIERHAGGHQPRGPGLGYCDGETSLRDRQARHLPHLRGGLEPRRQDGGDRRPRHGAQIVGLCNRGDARPAAGDGPFDRGPQVQPRRPDPGGCAGLDDRRHTPRSLGTAHRGRITRDTRRSGMAIRRQGRVPGVPSPRPIAGGGSRRWNDPRLVSAARIDSARPCPCLMTRSAWPPAAMAWSQSGCRPMTCCSTTRDPARPGR